MNKRDKLVAIYLTEDEKERLQALAAREERKLGEYLRRVILAATQSSDAPQSKPADKPAKK